MHQPMQQPMQPTAGDEQHAHARPRRGREPTRGTVRRDLAGAAVADLVVRARDGDSDAFGLLYLEFRRKIFNLARFSLPHAAAEDVVAETFVRAWAALPRYRDTGAPFVAWLYGIARHVVADVLRSGSRVEPQAEPDQGAVDAGERHDDRLVVGWALTRLPEEQRTVIELKFLAGLTNEEVALALGKTPGAVNTQQWRALMALRSFLEAG
ncbi:MAG TPA: sigma-70 family RNA polymerase sigma factor [Acidimicrobiia bacterium]|nr:sigma-70 family RNA polymerase sigma factor [Acidimicrobiia bacterium]